MRNAVDVELPFYRCTILYIIYSPFLDTTMSQKGHNSLLGL